MRIGGWGRWTGRGRPNEWPNDAKIDAATDLKIRKTEPFKCATILYTGPLNDQDQADPRAAAGEVNDSLVDQQSVHAAEFGRVMGYLCLPTAARDADFRERLVSAAATPIQRRMPVLGSGMVENA